MAQGSEQSPDTWLLGLISAFAAGLIVSHHTAESGFIVSCSEIPVLPAQVEAVLIPPTLQYSWGIVCLEAAELEVGSKNRVGSLMQ